MYNTNLTHMEMPMANSCEDSFKRESENRYRFGKLLLALSEIHFQRTLELKPDNCAADPQSETIRPVCIKIGDIIYLCEKSYRCVEVSGKGIECKLVDGNEEIVTLKIGQSQEKIATINNYTTTENCIVTCEPVANMQVDVPIKNNNDQQLQSHDFLIEEEENVSIQSMFKKVKNKINQKLKVYSCPWALLWGISLLLAIFGLVAIFVDSFDNDDCHNGLARDAT